MCVNLRNNFWKSKVDISSLVHAVAKTLNTCRVALVVTSVSHVLSDKRDTSRHVTFPMPNALA